MKDAIPFVLQKMAYYSSSLAFPALVLGTCVNVNIASEVKKEGEKTYVRPPVVLVNQDGSVEVWDQGTTRGDEKNLQKLVENRGRRIAQVLFSNPQNEAVIKAKAAEIKDVFSEEKISVFKSEVSKSAAAAQKVATEYVAEKESVQYVKSHKAWVYIANGTMIESSKGGNTSRKVTLKLGFTDPSDAYAKENPNVVLVVTDMEVSREAI